MIKQRLSRNETRFQWVEGATMLADGLTKAKERGHVELLRKLLHTARYQIRATRRKDGKFVNESHCDTKNADEQPSDDIEKHL